MGCVCIYMQEMELLYWKEYADEKKVKLVEWKPLVDTVESKSADLKYNFSLEFLAFLNCLEVGKGRKQPFAA